MFVSYFDIRNLTWAKVGDIYQFTDLSFDEMNKAVDELIGPFASVSTPEELFGIEPSIVVRMQNDLIRQNPKFSIY